MNRIILSTLLILCSLIGFAQDATIPGALSAPKNSKLIVHVFAKGVQIYTSAPNLEDSSKYKWKFIGPSATLYADENHRKVVGEHYLDNNNPTWEWVDSSKVSGSKLSQVNSPDSLAIPWLLLKATINKGNGVLSHVVFIQRINTKGGKAPSAKDRIDSGKTVQVPYTAEYLFYGE